MGMVLDKLDCIRLFCHVARLGSFTATANELNITQGAVSKKIAWLEKSLGFSLFNRNSRKIRLSGEGEEYLTFCKELVENMTITEQQLRNELNHVVGKLKISAPSAFATERLALPLQVFMAENPDVLVDVSVNDKQVDLFSDDIDVAIRASFLSDSGLRAKKLLTHKLSYFASPEYIKVNGLPQTPEELSDHSCVTYSLSSPSNIWYIDNKKITVPEVITSDSPEMIVRMALLGVGIAAMPKWMVQGHFDSGRLIEIFKDVDAYFLPMYAVYKDNGYLPHKVRAFIDFLANYFDKLE